MYLDYWAPYSDTRAREHKSKRSTYHQWCALQGITSDNYRITPMLSRILLYVRYSNNLKNFLASFCFLRGISNHTMLGSAAHICEKPIFDGYQ